MKNIFLCLFVFCYYTITNCMASDILYLKYPSGGEQLTVNNTYTIAWEIEDSSSTLDIYLWNGDTGTWSVIDTNVNQFVSFYEWTVPDLSSGESYRLKLVSNATNVISFSRGYITIQSNLPRIGEFFNFDSICFNFFIISPNPAWEYIEITCLDVNPRVNPWVDGGVDEIRIYNVLGEYVLPTPALHATPQERNIRIDISNLPSGIYFVRIGDWTGSFVKVE